QRQRHPAYFPDQRTHQRANRNPSTDERAVGEIVWRLGGSRQRGGSRGVLGPSDKGNDIATVKLRVRQDGDGSGGRASRDFSQENFTSAGEGCQVSESLTIPLFIGYVNVHSLHRNAQKFGIVNLYRHSFRNARDGLATTCNRKHLCAFTNNTHERLASTCNRHHIALAQNRVRGCLLDDPVTPYALDKNARLREQRLGLDGAKAND